MRVFAGLVRPAGHPVQERLLVRIGVAASVAREFFSEFWPFTLLLLVFAWAVVGFVQQ